MAVIFTKIDIDRANPAPKNNWNAPKYVLSYVYWSNLFAYS